MADRLPTIWELAPHTAAKHDILRRYLGAWYAKLSWTGKLVFIDGFAGPEEYTRGEPGSPIIALNVALDHKADLSNCELIYLFVEEDHRRHAHLESILNAMDFPEHMRILAERGTFDSKMADVFEGLGGHEMAPAFVMVDPFGVKGVTYEVIERLGQYPRSEILLSFMYESVSRWIGTDEFEPHLKLLFGDEGEWRAAREMEGTEKRVHLHNLMIARLRDAGFGYVRSFEMIDDGGRTEYFLLYGTHNIEGLKSMKAAMWAVDPTGGIRFSDATDAKQTTLFQLDPDFDQLRSLLIGEFAGRWVRSEELTLWALVHTAFRETHVKKPILRPMEEAGELEVDERSRNRIFSYPNGTRLRLSGGD